MEPPKSLTQLRSLQGKLAYIRRFVSNLSGRCQPFSALTKKDVRFHWDEACQHAFDDIKCYLLNPPVLAAPVPGRPLILYIATLDESIRALLAQMNEEEKENALYYLSRRFIPAEMRYPPIEKHCLSLVFSVQKLRHYMLSHHVDLISRVNPLQYLMTRPTLAGRLARWAMILSQFDISYVPQRAVKGQALAEFLAAHPIPADSPLNDDFPDEHLMVIDAPEWEMYFDGASSLKEGPPGSLPKVQSGIGLIFVSPEGGILRYSYSLAEPCTNNAAEYEGLILGLELAIQMGITRIKIYGDSQLIISQILGTYRVLKPELLAYHEKAMTMLKLIPEVTLIRIPRSLTDALAKLVKELSSPDGNPVTVVIRERRILSPTISSPSGDVPSDRGGVVLATSAGVSDDWRQDIIAYLTRGILPDDRSLASQIQKRALSFTIINDTLYRRSFEQMWLRCVGDDEAQKLMAEVHEGVCGSHQSGPKMKIKIKRLGYYWPMMTLDCIEHAKRCHQCQVFSPVLHQPPSILHPTVASWPFEASGTDIVGPIDPPSSRGHRFILAATDFFSKWAEAIPLREVRADNMLHFLKNNIVYRFVGLIKKILHANKKEWHEKLSEALWAYRTTYRTPTSSTPYALTFGSEAVLPLEVELPSLRIAISNNVNSEDNTRLRLEELDSLEGLRLQAQQNLELYRARMARAHDKLVRPCTFMVGDLVLVLRRPIISHRRSHRKFEPTWEGPFVIEKVYEGGAYFLIDADGSHPMPPINGRYLKRYYA
ncbi:uncharacterized protein LOC110038079 [Phalaenopsis equestris]|uniref:uncharacterized protein LOC110038079 n=1 Tax=Phalaenopsis equestris TaxID=78828 RepID=UPI0009E60CA3|nr:uncharacterized protein LOC110038079 [Phalaenopsis equestris]